MPRSAPEAANENLRQPPQPGLDLPLDKVSFIILKAREYDVKEEDSDPDEGSNAIDDGMTDVLESDHEDPVREELLGAIKSLSEDERCRLIALAWLGRGTYGLDEWEEAVETARSEHRKRAAQYLLGLPLLGDYLEDGLAMFDEGIFDGEPRPPRAGEMVRRTISSGERREPKRAAADPSEGLDGEDEPLDGMKDRPPRQ